MPGEFPTVAEVTRCWNDERVRLGILCGGGPAPGMNSVISAATIEARNCGWDVVGIMDGFEHLIEGRTGEVRPLSITDVSRIHAQGGSIIRTSRANPTVRDELVNNLMTDAMTTQRWYLVVAMGRSAGHLAVGIGKSAGATLTVIAEEFPRDEPVRLSRLVDVVETTMLKRIARGRPFGVVVLAEGIGLRLPQDELCPGRAGGGAGRTRPCPAG